jgi:hypothetical protein
MDPWLMTTNKIALKERLKHIPGAGFGMQASLFVFLKRELNTDMQRMVGGILFFI